MPKLKLGLPKGSLQVPTMELFRKAGIRIYVGERSYFPTCADPELEVMLVRAQEIARYVEDGTFDAGLTGYDWIRESKAKVKEVCELIYSKSGYRPVKWILAVSNNSRIKSVKDLEGKKIATELVNVVKDYLKKRRVKAEVEFSWGATEGKAGTLADAIVELTETGSSLAANYLRGIDTVIESTTRLIANSNSYQNPWKRNKIDSIAILLQGALTAEGMVGLKMNAREKDIPKLMKILPALKKPTVSRLTIPGWVALEVILNEEMVKKILPELKRAGAQGIIEYPLNKVIL